MSREEWKEVIGKAIKFNEPDCYSLRDAQVVDRLLKAIYFSL